MLPSFKALPFNMTQPSCYTIIDNDDDQTKPGFKTWSPITEEATEFVTLNLLGSDDTLTQMRLVHYIQQLFRPNVTAFENLHDLPQGTVHFIFKGGNIMRFVVHALAIQRPSIINDIKSNYLDVFKASDLDFSIIVPQPHMKNIDPQDIHNFTRDCAITMKKLRDQLIHSPDLIDGLNTSNNVLQTAFDSTFLKIQRRIESHNKDNSVDPLPTAYSMHCMNLVTGVTNTKDNTRLVPSVTRKDITISFENDKTAKNMILTQNSDSCSSVAPPVRVCESKEPAQILYVSTNESLIFSRDGSVYQNEVLHFDLVRIKLCFELVLDNGIIKKIGGEVVDLSIPHPDGVDQTPPIFKRISDGSFIDVYKTYKLQTSTETYSVESYSICGLIYDIIRTLFIEISHPWDDKKYKKRMKRIMGLLLCEAFEEQSLGVNTYKLTRLMRSFISPTTHCNIEGTIWCLVRREIQRVRFETTEAYSVQLKEFVDTLTQLVEANIDALQTSTESFDLYTQTNIY